VGRSQLDFQTTDSPAESPTYPLCEVVECRTVYLMWREKSLRMEAHFPEAVFTDPLFSLA
jgi:hypothetical protein